MNSPLTLLTLLAAILLAWSSPAAPATASSSSPPTTPSSLTLDQALALADQHHPTLAEARALVEASEARAQLAGRFPPPEAIARLESTPLRHGNASDADLLAGFGQSIPLGARLARSREVGDAELTRQSATLAAQQLDLHRRVQAAFAVALVHQAAQQAHLDLAQSQRLAVTLTQARQLAGDLVPADTARAELDLAQLETETAQSATALTHARIALAQAIGLDSLPADALAGDLNLTLEIPALETLACDLASHPALAAAEADLRSHDASVALAQAQRIPDLQVELLYRRRSEAPREAFDVGLSLPLPLFDRPRSRVREADAERLASAARAQSVRQDLQARLRDAHARLVQSLDNCRRLEIHILPRVEHLRNTAEQRRAAGDLSTADVLPLRRAHAQARLSHLDALHDAWQAWTEVRFLTHHRQALN